MTGEAVSHASRALSFGAIADEYDRIRPGYPARLADDIAALLASGRPTDGRPRDGRLTDGWPTDGRDDAPAVVEVGAGTGKASVLLAARRIRLTCLEPDPAMAAILAERLGGEVDIVTESFERWVPDRRYEGLVSAQAWHWTDVTTRYAKAALTLAPGGLVALFWNFDRWGGDGIHGQVNAVYDSFGIGKDYQPLLIQLDGRTGREIAMQEAFTYLGVRSYEWRQRYTSNDFVAYLNTTSHHRILPADLRDRLARGIRDVVDEHGGHVTVERRADLHLARRHV